MYFDLKEVPNLNLNRFYAANPNAIAMQVCAGALVYAAMRAAQGQVAHEAGIEPEEISPAKFFPRMAARMFMYTQCEWVGREYQRANPQVKLRVPDWKRKKFTTVRLQDILVEQRHEVRRRRRFCKARSQWTSLAKVPGGSELTWRR